MDDELDIAARRLIAMAELDEVVRTEALKTMVAEAGGSSSVSTIEPRSSSR